MPFDFFSQTIFNWQSFRKKWYGLLGNKKTRIGSSGFRIARTERFLMSILAFSLIFMQGKCYV